MNCLRLNCVEAGVIKIVKRDNARPGSRSEAGYSDLPIADFWLTASFLRLQLRPVLERPGRPAGAALRALICRTGHMAVGVRQGRPQHCQRMLPKRPQRSGSLHILEWNRRFVPSSLRPPHRSSIRVRE